MKAGHCRVNRGDIQQGFERGLIPLGQAQKPLGFFMLRKRSTNPRLVAIAKG